MPTTSFATFDSGAAPIDWERSPHAFPTPDSAAAVVPMAGDSIGSQTTSFPTLYRKAQPGRWRDYEG